MIDSRPVTREMLIGQIDVRLDENSPDFQTAKTAADREAAKRFADPVLLAWFDRNAWQHSPAIC